MSPYAVDRKKWARQSIFEQMGNIYSEVGRTLAAKNQADSVRFTGALTRALDLFEATSEVLVAQKSPRLKEVLRSKELFLQAATTQSADKKECDWIEKYFYEFAVAARLAR